MATVAGSDTTATAIRATLLNLVTSKRVYEKLQREIDDAAAQGRISSPITHEEAKQLPYLQVCPSPVTLHDQDVD